MSQILGKVVKLFISEDNNEKRIEQDSLELDQYGVKGDKFYNKKENRSVLLTSQDSYNIVKQNGVSLDDGTLGENILIDFDPYSLDISQQISIDDLLLEITQECTICKSLNKIDKCVPKLMKNNRGMFAKVINPGNISVDSIVRLVK